MIQRLRHLHELLSLLRQRPVVALLGPRQVGKTTLARMVLDEHPGDGHWFDLEDPRSLARLSEPMLALESLRGLVVLDEIQLRPDLFRVLRVLCDRPDTPCRFLVLGSASPRLLKQGSESLAGRIAYHELSGFSLEETGIDASSSLWLRGGFPVSFLAASEKSSLKWRSDFVRSFLERDLPELGVTVPSATMRRFWTMLAHYHGQIWNGSELARAFGVSESTVRRYLDHLSSTYLVRSLLPWHENMSKRQVKAPKVYLTDSGILHFLLDIRDQDQLLSHPKVGASFEGFALHQVMARLRLESTEAYTWATHSGAELDLLVVRGNARIGFEFKRTDSPQVSKSMRQALKDLKLDHLWVVCMTRDRFPLAPRIEAIGLEHLATIGEA